MRIPKIQNIKYTISGRPYVTFYHFKIYLEEVMRLDTPIVIDGIFYTGEYTISNSSGFLIHLAGNNEYARVKYCY